MDKGYQDTVVRIVVESIMNKLYQDKLDYHLEAMIDKLSQEELDWLFSGDDLHLKLAGALLRIKQSRCD